MLPRYEHCILDHRYFLGSLRDYSGNDNSGTVTSCSWLNSNGVDSLYNTAAAGKVSVADNSTLDLRDMTLHLYFPKTIVQSGTQSLFAKSTNYAFQARSDRLRLGSGGNSDLVTAAFSGAYSVTVAIKSGEFPEFFANGASLGLGDTTLTPAPAAGALTLVGDGTNKINHACSYAVMYNVRLTATEVLTLHNWSSSRFTPRKQWPGMGLRYPGRETNLLTDGDMEAADTSAYTPGNAAVLSKTVNGHRSGGKVLRIAYGGSNNPYAYQSVQTVGRTYRAKGWARGDGVAKPRLEDGSVIWTGTVSTDWQEFDEIFVAGSVSCILRANTVSASYAEFDSVTLWDQPPGYTTADGDPLFLDNIQSARTTLANETSGTLSNSTIQISTGTWAIAEDASKYVSCESSGISHQQVSGAYGTWEFDFYKGASSPRMSICAAVPKVYTDSSQNGYMLQITSGGSVRLFVITAGVAAALFYSADAFVDASTWYRFKITRSLTGEFTCYVRGGVYKEYTVVDSSAAGSNPVTNNTHTASEYVVFDLDTGDRLRSFSRYSGVI